MTPNFKVSILSCTHRPNLLSYFALHQCYSEKPITEEWHKISRLSNEELGERVVNRCVKFGHWSVLEAPAITFCVEGYPHSVMVQARTHRIGINFQVQSQRYTCKRILDLAEFLWTKEAKGKATEEVEKLFYFRPVGFYADREGNQYEYTNTERNNDISDTINAVRKYYLKVKEKGFAPEHARDFLLQNIRQNFVVTFNARSLLHFCDLRLPKDAQLEIRILAESIFEHFKEWMPEVGVFYEKTRYGKNRLSP